MLRIFSRDGNFSYTTVTKAAYIYIRRYIYIYTNIRLLNDEFLENFDSINSTRNHSSFDPRIDQGISKNTVVRGDEGVIPFLDEPKRPRGGKDEVEKHPWRFFSSKGDEVAVGRYWEG